jgi:hypothetical protein
MKREATIGLLVENSRSRRGKKRRNKEKRKREI